MPEGRAETARRAVFLDRDGTIVEDPGFLHEPGKVRLIPDAGEAIHQLNQAGCLGIILSNQSGNPPGPYHATPYGAVPPRLVEPLPPTDARLDSAALSPTH